MIVRIAKLVVLLLLAIGIGFLVGLLRPRRVVSRDDLVSRTTGGGSDVRPD